jgi:D-serine deaminase-like pyridoxal phosphate-dependent protein
VDPAPARYSRYRRAIEGELLPLALVDLDALEANVDTIAAKVRGTGKRVRVASKSVRSPALIRRILERLGPALAGGVMTYDAAETAFLAAEGFDDLLLAYPTAHPADAALLADAIARGAQEGRDTRVVVMVDDARQLDVLGCAADARGVTMPVAIDVDVAYRPFGERGAHLGVRRSPIRTEADAARLHARIAATRGVSCVGLMAYEAQIAGVADDALHKRALKALSRLDVAARRAELVEALRAAGATMTLVNAGGTGSLGSSPHEPVVTEVTAGSGFLCSHLFDRYLDVPLEPAAYFALQVTRTPAPGLVTCAGGGFVASGAAGRDRLPRPALPAGLALLVLEGAGEVQTPLVVPREISLAIGDPVFFRHAKAGELAEHVPHYLLVRGDRLAGRAATYRGLGACFLG